MPMILNFLVGPRLVSRSSYTEALMGRHIRMYRPYPSHWRCQLVGCVGCSSALLVAGRRCWCWCYPSRVRGYRARSASWCYPVSVRGYRARSTSRFLEAGGPAHGAGCVHHQPAVHALEQQAGGGRKRGFVLSSRPYPKADRLVRR